MNKINKKLNSEKINDFCIFCLEAYKFEKEIAGEEAYNIFEKYKVFKYLKEGYEVLHTQSINWILNDIEGYLKLNSK